MSGIVLIMTSSNGFKLTEGRFRLIIGKKFFIHRVSEGFRVHRNVCFTYTIVKGERNTKGLTGKWSKKSVLKKKNIKILFQ